MKTKVKTITKEQALKAGNDGRNQSIKAKFIEREIYCNVNSLAEYALNKSHEDSDAPFSLDDIENYYSYPEYIGEYADFSGGSNEDRDTEIERLRDLQSYLYDSINSDNEQETEAKRDKIEDEITELENLESEPAEIFEWWAVSSWMFESLKEHGKCVVDTGSTYIWGRCTTGQAILLDYVITEICADLEILEGQANEWKV